MLYNMQQRRTELQWFLDDEEKVDEILEKLLKKPRYKRTEVFYFMRSL